MHKGTRKKISFCFLLHLYKGLFNAWRVLHIRKKNLGMYLVKFFFVTRAYYIVFYLYIYLGTFYYFIARGGSSHGVLAIYLSCLYQILCTMGPNSFWKSQLNYCTTVNYLFYTFIWNWKIGKFTVKFQCVFINILFQLCALIRHDAVALRCRSLFSYKIVPHNRAIEFLKLHWNSYLRFHKIFLKVLRAMRKKEVGVLTWKIEMRLLKIFTPLCVDSSEFD